MLKQLFSSSNRLPVFLSAILLIGGLLLATVLYHQLSTMAETNQATVGKSLAYQLAYGVKTPMLHQDLLSLQVAVAEIARQPGVARVVVSDRDNRLLAEKVSIENANPAAYRSAINIEGAVAGYALIELQKPYYRRQAMQLFAIALTLLVLMLLAAGAVCWRWHLEAVARIRSLRQQLPGTDDDSSDDELTQLEQRLAPLLTVRQSSREPETPEQQYVTFAALQYRNFSRLQEQLSSSHFDEVLTELDSLLADILKLYNGKLVLFSEQLLVLRFAGENEEDDHPLRALYCVFALLKQLEKWRIARGLELDLATVLSTRRETNTDCDLKNLWSMAEQQQQLRRLQDKAGSGDILLDRATGEHPALDHIALLEPASATLDIFRCEGLEATADTLVVRQLAMLGFSVKPAA